MVQSLLVQTQYPKNLGVLAKDQVQQDGKPHKVESPSGKHQSSISQPNKGPYASFASKEGFLRISLFIVHYLDGHIIKYISQFILDPIELASRSALPRNLGYGVWKWKGFAITFNSSSSSSSSSSYSLPASSNVLAFERDFAMCVCDSSRMLFSLLLLFQPLPREPCLKSVILLDQLPARFF